MAAPEEAQTQPVALELPSFIVSAPGKVIVYGEHAVVYGKAAIAAAISLRSYLLVTPAPKDSETVTLSFPDISLHHSWKIDTLPWDRFNAPNKKKQYSDEVKQLDTDLTEAVQPFVSDIPKGAVQNAAACFLYLYLSLQSQNSPPAIYTLRSTIPIGAGLGSSASISVCLSAAFQLQHGNLTPPSPETPPSEIKLQQKRINNWAFVGEMCIHGNPSGVDNTVSVQGRAVMMKRRGTLPPLVTSINSFPELPLMLINTKVPRSTAALVAIVKQTLEESPSIVQPILKSIDQITKEALTIITSLASAKEPSRASHIRLGELMRINHGLLVSLGVSHPRLERIRELVDFAGIGWTKLTGAGGGGCSVTLLKPEVKQEAKDALAVKLKEEGFEQYETTLGGDGVGVLWPAVVRADVGGDEEVTPESLLNAEGVENLQKIVGVDSTGRGSGWRFWRLE